MHCSSVNQPALRGVRGCWSGFFEQVLGSKRGLENDPGPTPEGALAAARECVVCNQHCPIRRGYNLAVSLTMEGTKTESITAIG